MARRRGRSRTRAVSSPPAPWIAQSEDAQVLDALNRRLLDTLGLVRGVTHTEFIRAHADGRCYFLETASRVGGAFIVDVIAASTGLNLWHEWAKVEVAGEHGHYEVPPHRETTPASCCHWHGRSIPTPRYDAPESCSASTCRITPGSSSVSDRRRRVQELLESYAGRFLEDFYTSAPAPDTRLTSLSLAYRLRLTTDASLNA